MCTFGVLGLSCEAPAGEGKKKSEILGGPAEGGPAEGEESVEGYDLLRPVLFRPGLLRPVLFRPGQRRPGLVLWCVVVCVCVCVCVRCVCVLGVCGVCVCPNT